MTLASIVLPALTERPTNIQSILAKLRNSSVLVHSTSQSELNLLARKSLNYLNSKDIYLKWVGCNLIKTISVNPLILSNNSSEFIASLLKLLTISIIPSTLYDIAANTTLQLCLLIRGKPSLTREVLTPNLPNFIGTLVKKLDSNNIASFINSVSILSELTANHPTVFRPFASGYEKVLVSIIISDSFPTLGQINRRKIISSLVLLSLVNRSPALQWRVTFGAVLKEFQSVIELVFSEFLKVNEDNDPSNINKMVETLAQLNIESTESNIHNKSLISFPALSIDLNNIDDLSRLLIRFETLTELINGLITTPFGKVTISLPLGKLVSLAELLANVSSKLHFYKENLIHGNSNVKRALNYTFFQIQLNGIKIVNQLVQVLGKQTLVYFSKFSQLIGLVVPMKTIQVKSLNNNNKTTHKKIIDKEEVKAYKRDLAVLLEFVDNFLSLFDKGDLTDFSFVLKIVDMTVIMVEDTSYESLLEKNDVINKNSGGNGLLNNKKSKKAKNSVELSDFLSNPEALKIKLSEDLITQILHLYSIIVQNVPHLSLTQLIKIQNFTLLYSVRKIYQLNGTLPDSAKKLLQDFLLYQNTNEKFNLLPIVVSLLKAANEDNNEYISLLMNPRLPIANKLEIEQYDREEKEEEETSAKQQDDAELSEAKQKEAAENLEQIKQDLRWEIEKEVTQKVRAEYEEQETKRRKISQEALHLENNVNIWTKKELPVAESAAVDSKQGNTDVTAMDTNSAEETAASLRQNNSLQNKYSVSVNDNQVAIATGDDQPEAEDNNNGDDSDFEVPDIEVDSSDDDDD